MASNEREVWQQNNDAWLAAAVEWLRLLLAHHAPVQQPPLAAGDERGTQPPSAPGDPMPWWRLRRATDRIAGTPPPALPPATFRVTEEEVAAARARLDAAEAVEPPPALAILARRLGLSRFERDLLLLCIAMELDTRIAALCARAHDDGSRPYPTFALAMAIFDEPAWDALSPERPLRYWRLIEINQPGSQPLTVSALRADERIANYAKTLNYLDDRVAPFVSPAAGGHVELPPSQQRVAEAIIAALQADDGRLKPVQLLGDDSDSKELVSRAAAHAVNLPLYRMDSEMLPAAAADIETLARLWDRERLLLPLALYLDAHDVDRGSETKSGPIRRFLLRVNGVVFVDTKEAWPVATGTHTFDTARPEPAEQRALWVEALGAERAAEAGRLSAQFNLSAGAIRRIAAETPPGDEEERFARLWSGSARQTRLRIDALAERIDAKATWEQLVLPPAETALLRRIAEQVAGRSVVYDDWGFRHRMNRGFGISALFAGESGTGKTMAAEVIANELALTLHRVDLSAVVSKWVGETEKNIQRLFGAAEDGGGILFFDEADALFGKRTEVQHSQDRFANIEINFLLQRMESYRGLVILATNMKGALDQAFLRRLKFVVNFPFPGPAERRRMWERAFPAETPVEGLDFDHLARLSLAGGNIHNVVLTAAFAAAAAGEPVTMPVVLEAVRVELRKIGKPVSEAELKWSAPKAVPA